MQKIICFVMSVAILLCVCGCNDSSSNDNSSDSVEIIYEEIVETQGSSVANETSSDSSVDDSSSQPTTSTPSDIVSKDPVQTKPEDTGMYMLNDDSVLEKIKFNGRCEKTSDGVKLNLVASAIEFNTDSTAVTLEIKADAGVFYNIIVDGEVTVHHAETTQSGNDFIFAARGLSKGTHNIKIIRDSESRTDKNFTAVCLQLENGKLLAKDSEKTLIEILGDSITSGYGNLIENGISNPSDLKHQSSIKAYSYLVANELGFDYRIVSQSGIALKKREGYYAFPDFYNTENYHSDRDKKYTSSSPQDVDIVLVNIGTNDIGSKMYDTTKPEKVNEYIKYYADLITTIGYRKDAKIVFVSGIWYDDPAFANDGVVNELKARGYNNVYSLPFSKEYKSGGGGHPSSAEHEEIAQTIIKFFKNKGIA